MDRTATGATAPASDRLVRRDLLILRLEAGRRRRSSGNGRMRQRVTRSTR
ncbi:hypothetical protein [Kineosporia sp. A_224]|nr:hypothetical protein [Kineosporia sp. A_224]